jgi:hypothetical protein
MKVGGEAKVYQIFTHGDAKSTSWPVIVAPPCLPWLLRGGDLVPFVSSFTNWYIFPKAQKDSLVFTGLGMGTDGVSSGGDEQAG